MQGRNPATRRLRAVHHAGRSLANLLPQPEIQRQSLSSAPVTAVQGSVQIDRQAVRIVLGDWIVRRAPPAEEARPNTGINENSHPRRRSFL